MLTDVCGIPVPVFAGLIVLIPRIICVVAQVLQLSHIGLDVPPELKSIYDDTEYSESCTYSKAEAKVELAIDLYRSLVIYAIWFLGFFPWLDSVATALAGEIVQDTTSTVGLVVTGLIFISSYGIFNEVLVGLPSEIYRKLCFEDLFVELDRKNATVQEVIKSQLINFGRSFLVAIPSLCVVIWFFASAGQYAWVYVFLAGAILYVGLEFLRPVLIAPRTMKMIPFPDNTVFFTNYFPSDQLAFLSNRFFYPTNTVVAEKPTWTTQRLTNGEPVPGEILSIFWAKVSRKGPGWVIAEGKSDDNGRPYAWALDNLESKGKMTYASSRWKVNDELTGGRSKSLTTSLRNSFDLTIECIDAESLRRKLLRLAEKLAYDTAEVYLVDSTSCDSGCTHSDAVCMGFGRFRRICVFDSLVAGVSENQMMAIIAHEIGHARLHHVHKDVVHRIVYFFVVAYVMGSLIASPVVSSAFYVKTPKIYVGLILVSILSTVIEFVIDIPLKMCSRAYEYEADRYAVEADETYATDLVHGLKKITRRRKSNLTPHPLYVFLKESHPPLDRRIDAIVAHKQKVWGKQMSSTDYLRLQEEDGYAP